MRNPEETRNHIIKVAAPIFNRSGYVGTSISDVLEQTTLTKGAIYHHFENKDELALAALEYNLKIASAFHFNNIRDRTHSCEMLAAFADSFKNNYNLIIHMGGCPVMNAAVDSDDGNELIRNRVRSFIKTWRKSIVGIIEQGKSKSEIKVDVDSEVFSMNFISIIEGSLAMSKVSGSREFVDSAVELVKTLVEGIKV